MSYSDSPAAIERYLHAQRKGLRLAIFCRTAIMAVALFYLAIVTKLTEYDVRIWSIGALFIFVVSGVAHLVTIGTTHDRWWLKFLIYALDVIGICVLFVIIPVSRSDAVPQIIAFRAYGIYYLFPIVVLSALSLSWRLVLWTGAVAVLGWWAAFLWVVGGMERTLSWSDIPSAATKADYEQTFLSIDFIGSGNRVEETGFLFFATAILALVVYRARAVFFAQIRAEANEREEKLARESVTKTLGRFVPEEVADQIIAQDGALEPQESYGSILVLDVANFTGFAEGRKPTEVIEQLGSFLAECSVTIAAHSGVVTNYTGDGLLASFNAPLKIENSEQASVDAGLALSRLAISFGFDVRIGIATGQIVSGSIGSKERMAFTVYGSTVNLASRLESLGKKLGRQILIDSATEASLARSTISEPMGSQSLRGLTVKVNVFSIAVQS